MAAEHEPRLARPRWHDAEEPPPLAEAKLAAPRLRDGLVERARVLRLLDAGVQAALTLVAAPAGYGKTTAVRAWCAHRGAPLAWVTLDAGDNDPVRLWRYVATAIGRVHPGLGRPALRRLDIAGGSIESPIDEVMNALATFGDELVLVLDDVQTVTDHKCLASIDYALGHLPPTVRLILLTRTDPALRLPQLRAGGRLTEVRADDLAFAADEAHQLLVDRLGVSLDTEEVEMLRTRAEGWPAALLLAALWLRTVDDPHRAARAFRGDHRFIADYLSQEVIGSLDDDTRSLLLRLSVLGRFTAELCDGVLGRSDSASMIADLERRNLFVVRLEGGWFRIHPLFAEFAGFQLAALEPGAASEIHRRAAIWLHARGHPVEAAEHATAAGDHELVARLLVEHRLPLIRSGGARTLLRWVGTLPDDPVIEHPELAVGAATAAVMIGQPVLEQRRLLRLADRARRERPARFGPYPEAVALMVRATSVDGDVGRAVVDGRRAVAIAEADADDVLVAALAAYARALYLAGDLDGAWKAAVRGVEQGEADGRAPGHAFARSTMALVAADRGWLGSARTHAEKARSIAGSVGSSRSWLGANASAALGVVLAAEDNLAESERALVHAGQFFQDELATVHHAWLLLALARVRCRRGRLDDAEATLQSARELIGQLADCGDVPSLAAGVERDLRAARARAERGDVLEEPSEAERAVLRMLGSDLSIRQIGGELFLSPNTVRSHTRAIYRKLGVNSRAEAVARADALGLLGAPHSPM